MADFYKIKQVAIRQLETAIRQLTAEGKAAKQEVLLLEIARATGMTRCIRAHIEALVKAGKVSRSPDKKGELVLTWAGGEE